MKKVVILNPAAGHGDALKIGVEDDAERYVTVSVGDAERFVAERLKSDPDTHFIVCGGDGTINEVVNGIMASYSPDRAAFSAIPTGSGNDFVKTKLTDGVSHKIDLIKYNDRYCVNMINIGFDCKVVQATEKYKKKHRGSTAYMLGVLDVLCHKLANDFKIEYVDAAGKHGERVGATLLCALANGEFCGGGFNFAPLASLDDGLIDLLMVNVVSRPKFISILSKFREGDFIESDGTIKKKFKKVLEYVKCSEVHVSGMDHVCADGEISPETSIDATVVRNAINYIS